MGKMAVQLAFEADSFEQMRAMLVNALVNLGAIPMEANVAEDIAAQPEPSRPTKPELPGQLPFVTHDGPIVNIGAGVSLLGVEASKPALSLTDGGAAPAAAPKKRGAGRKTERTPEPSLADLAADGFGKPAPTAAPAFEAGSVQDLATAYVKVKGLAGLQALLAAHGIKKVSEPTGEALDAFKAALVEGVK